MDPISSCSQIKGSHICKLRKMGSSEKDKKKKKILLFFLFILDQMQVIWYESLEL